MDSPSKLSPNEVAERLLSAVNEPNCIDEGQDRRDGWARGNPEALVVLPREANKEREQEAGRSGMIPVSDG